MEMNQADLRIGDYAGEYIVKYERSEDHAWIVCDPSNHCETELKVESPGPDLTNENSIYADVIVNEPEPNLNSIQHDTSSGNNILAESIYRSSLDGELLNEELNRRASAEIFSKNEENLCAISAIVEISNENLEEISLGVIKKEIVNFESDWPYNENRDKRKNGKTKLFTKESTNAENSKENDEIGDKPKRRRNETKRRSSYTLGDDYHERSRKKADCMRDKRKKLYDHESTYERASRLASEAAKRREMRMYYETPEERRKRLDSEAARKRDYRMYNETADERRGRLDREAERRRVKRLTIYASETAEQRRERLNRESSKRRESRLNQYARESDEQRQERLRKDALRAREMRFTRSAIESEDERRQRLIKDAIRKRELRMNGGPGTGLVRNLTELQAVRNFDELTNDPLRTDDEQDNQQSPGGHYIGNWMMWFQNNVERNSENGDASNETENNVSREEKIAF